jgi:cytoskeletal protein RodZ
VHETDSSPQDPDDWFAESAWASPRTATVTSDVEPKARRRRPLSDLTFTLRTLLVAAGVVLALVVLLGLAIGGVFSSSGHPRSTPPATQTPRSSTPTTTPTTTAPQSPSIPLPTSTLKPGDTGAQVKLLQRALAKLGEAPGSVDGDYGPSTVAAVTRFQSSKKLTADGIVGPATLRALKRALTTSSTS